MIRTIVATLALAALSAALPAAAANGPAATLVAFRAAWARADAAALGQQFTADATFVAADGSAFDGADQIAQVFAAQFADRYAGSTIALDVAASKTIASGVATLRGGWTVARDAPIDCGAFFAVLRERQGGWRVAAFHETATPCPAR